MTRWHPGKQQRHTLLASIDGYLDAIASMQGRYREHVMNACLLQKRGRSPERTLRMALAKCEGTRIVSISAPAHWANVEHYLREEFLQAPLSKPAQDFCDALIDARRMLAFRVTDLIMFLAPRMEPGNLWQVELSHRHASRYNGCLIDYPSDVLWIISRHQQTSLQ